MRLFPHHLIHAQPGPAHTLIRFQQAALTARASTQSCKLDPIPMAHHTPATSRPSSALRPLTPFRHNMLARRLSKPSIPTPPQKILHKHLCISLSLSSLFTALLIAHKIQSRVDPPPSPSAHRSNTARAPHKVWFSGTEDIGAIRHLARIRLGGVGHRRNRKEVVVSPAEGFCSA
jgi:hypothetical protein